MITAHEANELMAPFNKEETFDRIERAIRTAATNRRCHVEFALTPAEARHFRAIYTRLIHNGFFCHMLDREKNVINIAW